MLSLSRQEFASKFGCKPGRLFDLTKILTKKHADDARAYKNQERMLVSREYGILTAPGKPDLIWALDVGYFVEKGNEFKAVIERVIIFDSLMEQEASKEMASTMQDALRNKN